MTDEFADWDGAYVLGALAADDRRRYEEHLSGCPACSAAVRELAGVPGILGELDHAEALAIRDLPDPNGLRDGAHRPDRASAVARRVARRRRRTRLLAAGAVVLAVLGASLAGWAVTNGAGRQPVPVAQALSLHPVGGSALTADLSVTPVGWGTRLEWSCEYREREQERGATPTYRQPVTYSLVVHTADGGEETVATWTSAGGEAKDLVAATAIPADSIASVDIRVAGTDRPLAES